MAFRTDLAVEAIENHKTAAALPHVRQSDRTLEGFAVHEVRILSEDAAREIGKPQGRYLTLELDALIRREEDAFPRACKALSTLLRELLHLVDEDTAAFNRIMAVFAMSKSTDEEKAARSAALQAATLYATQVPLRTMKTAFEVFAIVRAMAAEGNPNSVSDAGVGALAARSAVLGACLNVKINAAGLKDRAAADALVAEANAVAAAAERAEREVLEIVERKI